MNEKHIPWWNVDLGEEESLAAAAAITGKHVSQGVLTRRLEQTLATLLDMPHVVCCSSGTAALTMACLACGVGPGTEVIVPSRTFIATAHAPMLLGATVRLADSLPDGPEVDPAQVERLMGKRTRAVIGVHVNGRGCDADALRDMCLERDVTFIEDACQGFMSMRAGRRLGAAGRFACFSMSMGKLLTTGQGGFVACRDEADADLLRRIRSQGVLEVKRYFNYDMLAGNFKYTDILAAIGLVRAAKIETLMRKQRELYLAYKQGLASVRCLRLIELDVEAGELPVQAEVLCTERERFIEELSGRGIQAVAQGPDLYEAPHIGAQGVYPNSSLYSRHLMVLPSGPDQPLENVARVIQAAHELDPGFKPW